MSSRRFAVAANLLLAGLAVGFVLATLEVVFRLVPALLPAGGYGSGRFDPELQLNVHGTRMLYNKVRYVVREPNRDGFLDVDHEHAKPAGVFRVGFFGDSYVEAAQVELEDTFYRLLTRRSGGSLEALAFGISGWGTLHAFEAWKLHSRRYDLDAAFYVFVENDPGDNALEIGGRMGPSTGRSYADLTDAPPGYQVLRAQPTSEAPWWHGIGKLLQRHSLVAHAVRSRFEQLRTRGPSLRLTREAADMTSVAGAVPDANDLASSWPRRYAARAELLAERILAEWKREAEARGIPLAVLYVPRTQAQLTGEVSVEDTWLPWLREACAALGLPLLDPTDALLARVRAGERVYHDHWTPSGHEVIADLLSAHLASWPAPRQDAARITRGPGQ